MPKIPLHQGNRFTFRNGVDEFYWKGMATKQDPEAQSPDRPRLVVNGRYVGGHIVSRPPLATEVANIPLQTGLEFTPVGWELAFLGEHHSHSGTKLWWGAEFISGYTGGTFGYIDTDNDPEHNEVAVHLQSEQLAPVLVYYGGFIYAGAMGALRRLYRIAEAPGPISPVPIRLPADEVVVATPGYFISALHVHDGVLYFTKSSTGTDPGELCSWDGFQTTLIYTFDNGGDDPIDSGVAISTFREKVVVAAAGYGRLVTVGADGIASDSLVLASCSGYQNSLAQLKDKLYIAGGDDKIYSYSGTAIATARTLNAGTGEGDLNCLCTFNGRLYYAWKETLDGESNSWPWLGMYDPDTADANFQWKDDYKTLGLGTDTVTVTDEHSTGDQHPYTGAGGEADVTAMASYRGRLMVAITLQTDSLVADSKVMTHAVVNNPFSEWYVVHAYEDVGAVPAGPLYFEKQLAATGSDNERLIQFFKVF